MSSLDQSQPVSLRAAVIGLGLSVVVSLWAQYGADRLGYLFMTYTQLPSCLLLPFLLLVVVPNLIGGRLVPRWSLTPSELLVVFSMGLVASMVPDWGITKYLIAVITVPYYFASPENRWAETFFARLPDWLVLSDAGGAARGFYEGLSANQPIPWGAWFIPLFWWLSFMGALLLVGACLVVMIRKQWVEHERLRFPLGEVSLRLIGTAHTSQVPHEVRAFHTRTFHIGFIVTLLVMVWNCASYWGVWSHVPITGSDTFNLVIERSFPAIPIRLNVYALCFSFFAHAEILFSLWFFQLFSIVEEGLLARMGVASPSSVLVSNGLVGIQFIGGLFVFVLWELWIARHHLRQVWQKALGRATSLDDRDELFSYRTAVIGLLLGVIFVLFWLNHAGLSVPVALFFLFVLIMFYLAMARITAESGLIMMELPIKANEFTVGIMGSANLSLSNLTALGLSNGFARNWRTFSMVGLSHVAWMREHIWPGRRYMFRWLCLAFAVSILVSIPCMIYSGYTRGANNLWTTPGNFGVFFYEFIINWRNNATRISESEVLFLLSGGALNGLLTAGRYLFYWWPFHPIGIAVGAAGVVRNAILPIFLAWMIQMGLLRYGGVRLYRKAQPLFLGILVGYVCGIGLSYLIDTVWFPDSPHVIEWF